MCRLHALSSFLAIVVGNKHFDYSVIKSNAIKIMLELSYTHSKNTFILQNTGFSVVYITTYLETVFLSNFSCH